MGSYIIYLSVSKLKPSHEITNLVQLKKFKIKYFNIEIED